MTMAEVAMVFASFMVTNGYREVPELLGLI
jgi:hypothetical protein